MRETWDFNRNRNLQRVFALRRTTREQVGQLFRREHWGLALESLVITMY